MTRSAGALVALLAVLYAALFAGCVTGNLTLTFAAVLAVFLGDIALVQVSAPVLTRVLNAAGAGISWRVFAREMLLVVFLWRAGGLSRPALFIVFGAVLIHHVLHGLQSVIAVRIRAWRLRRLETRNLDVAGAELPPYRDSLHAANGTLLLQADALLIAAFGWALANGSFELVAPAAIVMVVVAALLVAALAPQVIALSRLPNDELRLEQAQRAVLGLSPRVILYFSGGQESVYQVNMWFETMERLQRPVLVLLRERRYLDGLAPTTLPILCLPFSVDLMNFRIPSARVALYVANVGRNIHLLREPGIKSAFIGHGDSDKSASFNPFTRVYDEVWVAGEAGRHRYARAEVGVRDDEIVLVGRPQLDGIHEASGQHGDSFTVLYAPTWEGWTEDLNQSSVAPMGADMVRVLLQTPGVRLVYKPHPLTGTVDTAAAVASDEIVNLIRDSGGPHVAVLDNARPLYDLFNESDALIGDVSSVVSDYLRSAKPYFVTNPADQPDELFRKNNPSAGAAYLIGPSAAGLPEGLRSARGADEMAAGRETVRTYLLGDQALDSMNLFRAAVDRLAAKATGPSETIGASTDDDELRAAADTSSEDSSTSTAAHLLEASQD